MISHRFPTPVQPHTYERSRSPKARDETVRLVWGQTSQFSIVNPPTYPQEVEGEATIGAMEPSDENGGFVVRLWPEEVWTEQTHRLSPVWRKFDVARIEADNDPATTMDVAVTTEVLIPIRSKVMKYTGGGSYVEDPGGLPYEERMIHSYLHLRLPPPRSDWLIVQRGVTEGVWPTYREEMFRPGTFTASSSWQTHFGSGMWTR